MEIDWLVFIGLVALFLSTLIPVSYPDEELDEFDVSQSSPYQR